MSALRLMVVHNRLVAPTGHTYTESLGWRRVCRERGIELSLYASRWATKAVLAETGAQPLFGVTLEQMSRFGGANDQPPDDTAPLQRFLVTSFEIANGCRAAWRGGRDKSDAVLFPWADAAIINGVAEWLADLAPTERPRLVFNIVRPETTWAIDEQLRQVSGDFSWFRFACRRLRALTDPARLVFTAVEPRLCRLVSQLGGMECSPAPLHKFYPPKLDLDRLRPVARTGEISIAAVGPDHTQEKGWALLPEVMGRVCGASDASFFVQVADRAGGEAMANALRAAGLPVRVSIQPGALPTEDYFRRLLTSDLILQPYNSSVYALMPSGVFADAVVCGAPVVAPAGTWIADRLAEGWGAGETFATPSSDAVAKAVLRAIGRIDDLRAKAAGQGEAWRRAHSLEAYVDHVMPRLGFAS
jgi:glycosyltransferase involved in cell wall biosynthesis